MAALAELVEHEAQTFTLEGLPMPLTMRLPYVMTDGELEAFSRRNKTFRIYRNAKGELQITSLLIGFRGGNLEACVSAKSSVFGRKNMAESRSAPALALPCRTARCAVRMRPGFQTALGSR